MNSSVEATLLQKYNVPVPRYTSYPTVPYWKDAIDNAQWEAVFAKDFMSGNRGKGISLYIHLPFCESLCTYCGCNKKITTNHSVEDEYIAAVHKEWSKYRSLMADVPVLKELHQGGGTPTFFSPDNLNRLLAPILAEVEIHPHHEFSFEGHPNNTTREHLQALFDLGFRRVSYGVQDNDPEVQRIINRIQPFENVCRATEMAREIGYRSVNFDLIYGLPKQITESIKRTIKQTISLRPDRVAFYSYAHVPWTSRGQRLFDEGDLPSAQEKLLLYQAGKELFLQAGYKDVGMDHFALPEDDLFIAREEGRLHRNFMGYTTHSTDILIGLGVSAISSIPGGYAQNDKTIHNYYSAVNAGALAVNKGYFLSEEDRRFARYIMEISCNGYTEFDTQDAQVINEVCRPFLEPMEQDGLIRCYNDSLVVTENGRTFTRNICSAFDLHLLRSKIDKEKRVFSNAV
jgi:oxygen-independent coproporphyrinogen-3 oxidase